MDLSLPRWVLPPHAEAGIHTGCSREEWETEFKKWRNKQICIDQLTLAPESCTRTVSPKSLPPEKLMMTTSSSKLPKINKTTTNPLKWKEEKWVLKDSNLVKDSQNYPMKLMKYIISTWTYPFHHKVCSFLFLTQRTDCKRATQWTHYQNSWVTPYTLKFSKNKAVEPEFGKIEKKQW
jgi:hypothetical protein